MTKRIAALVLVLVIAAAVAGCAKKVTVSISSTIPAAQAEIKTGKDKNDNSVIDLKVKHMAPAENLRPARSTYVVWVETPDRKTINVGRLKLNDNLEGEIRIMTPYPAFRLVVSAEDNALPVSPSSQRVIETGPIEIK